MSERALARVTLSFLIGVACYGAWQGCGAVLRVIVSSAVSLVFLASCVVFWKKRDAWRLLQVLLCFAACLLGLGRRSGELSDIDRAERILAEQGEVTLEGQLYKKEEKNGQYHYFLQDSVLIRDGERIGCRRVLIYSDADGASIGDTIRVSGTGEIFHRATNEGNYDERGYYQSKDVLFRVRDAEVTLLKEERFPWKEMLYRLRRAMLGVFADQLSPEQAGVLGTMTLGDKELLDAELKKLYQNSGISHILAISGMHVSVLGMGLFGFLRKRGLSYRLAGTSASVLVLLFGQLSGMELSAERAVLMFFVLMLANACGMAYDSVTALSLSALLQLWRMPGCLWNAGFQFSYGAVLSAVVVARVIRNFFKGVKDSQERSAERGERKKEQGAVRPGVEKEQGRERSAERLTAGTRRNEVIRAARQGQGVAKPGAERGEDKKGQGKLRGMLSAWGQTIALSSCIQLVTLPLSIYYYFEFPVYSICTNALLVPLMGVVLGSGLLGGLIGLVSPTLAHFALLPAAFLLDWNERVCGLFQRLPHAVQITGRPAFASLVGYYVLLVAILCAMQFLGGMRRAWRLLVGAVPVLMLGLLLFVRPRSEPEICFLDVGQGDGIFLQAEGGTAFFVDGGSSSEKQVGEYQILSFLKCRGVSRIDGWFVSHADSDHISGLQELWESGYRIDRLFLAEGIVRDEAWEGLCEAAGRHGTAITYLRPQDEVETEEVRLTCLYPFGQGTERNAASMALMLEMPGFRAFLGGDLGSEQEEALLASYPDLSVDVYKASHHGSNGSNSAEFLQRVSPAVTVISCGKDNHYGHPGAEALEHIAACGSQVFLTMEQGQITVGCDEGGIWVKPYLVVPPSLKSNQERTKN